MKDKTNGERNLRNQQAFLKNLLSKLMINEVVKKGFKMSQIRER